MKDFNKLELTVLEKAEVAEMTGLDSETVGQLVFEESLPQLVVVCGQEVGWSVTEVNEWMWIKAIEASWRGDRGWRDGAYSAVRHPSNVLDLDPKAYFQMKDQLRETDQNVDPENRKITVNQTDPFAVAVEKI